MLRHNFGQSSQPVTKVLETTASESRETTQTQSIEETLTRALVAT